MFFHIYVADKYLHCSYTTSKSYVSSSLDTYRFNGPWRKTDIAIKIAKSIDAEIVSADSMLVYRGMDIGTEKPPREIRNKIPHHLIDIVEPWEEYNVGQYVKDFDIAIHNIYQRGKPFIVVGGYGPLFKGNCGWFI